VPLETVGINLSGSQTYEAFAALIATVAHPGDAGRRERFFSVLCRETIKQMAVADEKWACTPQMIKPIYFTIGDQISSDAMAAGTTELNRRFVDAHRRFLPHAIARTSSAKIRVAGFALSVNNLASLTLGDLGLGDSLGLVKTRFNQSRPVLHAAAALVYYQQVLLPPAAGGHLARILAFDATALAGVVDMAEQFRLLIPFMPEIAPNNPICDAETIQFMVT
jgi:hypothetical protein